MFFEICVEENEVANIIRYLHSRQLGKVDTAKFGEQKIPASIQTQLKEEADDFNINYDIENVLRHVVIKAIDKMENKEGGRE